MQLSFDYSSWLELLFWLPTIMDSLLLVIIYGSCSCNGVTWFLQQQDKKNDDANLSEEKLPSTVHQIWEFAMLAYSAYACLLPFGVYSCIIHPDLRPAFCFAMTVLMLIKIRFMTAQERSGQEKGPDAAVGTKKGSKGALGFLFFFYLPTYGGYAIIKTFFVRD